MKLDELNALVDATVRQFLTEVEAGRIYDVETAPDWVEKLKSGIKAPFVNVYSSTLGGPRNISILITISMEDKKDWANGIFQNSKSLKLHLLNKGALEVITQWKFPTKFRKTNVKTPEEAIKKINTFINQ